MAKFKRGVSGTELSLGTDYTSTTPTAPATGTTLFSRFRGRRLLASIDPGGQDTRYQPALFSNRVARVNAVNAFATPTFDGINATILNNATAAATAVQNTTTNLYSAMVRFRVSSTTTAGTAGNLRSTTAQWFPSTTANLGGFHFVARFGLATAASGTRGFVGMTSQTGAYAAGTNPSAQLNQIGFYWDAGATTMKFVTAGTVVGTPVDLGANFPITTAATYFYECSIYVPSGAGQYGFWSATRVNDGSYVGGTFGSSGLSGNTTIPAISTLLTAQMNYGNGTLAAAHSMDIQSMYIESDN